MSDMLFCVNKNSFHHEDSYDGTVYQFPPGEKVGPIPLPAAQHMFGVGQSDLDPVLQRKGWAFRQNPETKSIEKDPDGFGKLKNFHWTKAQLVEQALPE